MRIWRVDTKTHAEGDLSPFLFANSQLVCPNGLLVALSAASRKALLPTACKIRNQNSRVTITASATSELKTTMFLGTTQEQFKANKCQLSLVRRLEKKSLVCVQLFSPCCRLPASAARPGLQPALCELNAICCSKFSKPPSSTKTYLTEMEKSPGLLSLSRRRKAPGNRLFKSIFSASCLGILPEYHLDEKAGKVNILL